MQFINNAPVYKLVRVTGPTHNLLVLQFSATPVEGPTRVEALDSAQACANPIGAPEVLENAMRAIEDCAVESGRRYFLEAIGYLAGDSRPVEVYYDMTKEIIRRIELQSS
jgi:hypothetical protein